MTAVEFEQSVGGRMRTGVAELSHPHWAAQTPPCYISNDVGQFHEPSRSSDGWQVMLLRSGVTET